MRNTTTLKGGTALLAVLSVAMLSGVSPVTATAGANQQDTVTFTFAPPDGTKARVVTRIRRTLVLDDVPQQSPPEEARYRLEFRTSPSGVIIRQIPELGQSSKWMAASKSVQGLAEGLINASDLTFRFDRTGRFLGESGLNQSLEQIRDRIPAESHLLFKQLGPFAVTQIQELWRSRFTTFLGRPFPVGKYGSMPLSSQIMPGTTIPGVAEIGVQGRAQHQGRSVVKTMAGWTTKDPRFGERMSSFMVDSLRTTLESIKDPRVPAALSRLKTVDPQVGIDQFYFINERLIDPNTMLTYHETYTRAFGGWVAADGAKSKLAFRQISELTYDYQR